MRDLLEADREFSIGATDKNFLARSDTVKGIKLPESTLEKIYSLDFLRIVGDKPAKLNIPLAKEECYRIGEILEKKYNYSREDNFGYQAVELLNSIN
ncbi:MAG: hypothetical protein ACP5K2_10205 [bacterium]